MSAIMRSMKVEIHQKPAAKNGLLLVPVFEEEVKKLPAGLPKTVQEFIKRRAQHDDFQGKKDQLFFTYLHAENLPEKCLVFGCGKKKEFDGKLARELGGKVGKSALKHKAAEATITSLPPHFAEFAQGLQLAQYDIGRLKTGKEKAAQFVKVEKINVVSGKKDHKLDTELKKIDLLCEAADFVKDLVNGPSNIIDIEYLAREATKIAHENGYKVKTHGNKELKKMGAGGILAVNQGTKKDAKLIVLEYHGGKAKEKPLVLIGKGVIFDTGGYNLKPVNHIEEMHQDMAGGATVLGIFKVLKRLGIKRNIIGVIPVVENLISETAYRPSDIITMLSGKTVEITNTDAEGRLILADAITHGVSLKPASMITVATLTGAVGIAVGNRYCGLVGNDNELTAKLRRAGDSVDDLGWPLPLHEDYKKKMESKIADLRNYDEGSGRFAGCSKGAAFLEKFVEGIRWCHVDIGGTAFTNDPKEYETKGATAHSFRMLVKFLEG